MSLPRALHARALTHDDAAAAFEVYAADQLADCGQVSVELDDIVADWSRPSVDVSQDTVGVYDGDELVAAAEVTKGGTRAEGAVLPSWRGHGVGTWLVDWTEARSRALGVNEIGQNVPAGSAAERLLRARGYDLGHTAWVLELPAGALIANRALPRGFRLVTGDSPQRGSAAYTVIEDAFAAWPGRLRESYPDWRATTVDRPGSQPWQLRLVEDDAGRCVAAAFTILDSHRCAYVHQLAVVSKERGRGFAQALLADAFSRARDRGAVRSELSTDSRTGALGLYEKVGMNVTQTWVFLRRSLTGGSAQVGTALSDG